MAEFLMPILGADMTEGKVVSWHKKPGDRIERGDIVVEVETDKANVEVECYTRAHWKRSWSRKTRCPRRHAAGADQGGRRGANAGANRRSRRY
jgi:hypothetical protein